MLLKNFTLMYVEDDTDAQKHMKAIFEDLVSEFYQAYDGKEGLKLYEEKKPDIILSDVNMPVMDGLEMAKRIKEIDFDQNILLLSAFDDKDILLDALNIGIDGFVSKPIDIDVLMQKLQQIAKNLQNKKDARLAREQKLNELHNLAHYDTLTKICNRYLFNILVDRCSICVCS